MLVKLFCPQCANEVSKSLVDYAEIDVPVPVSKISDSGEYQVVCGKGHNSYVVLRNLKFELLYEMGLNLLLDGYSKDAVGSFATALERFYEFYWRVSLMHQGVSEENIESAWKHMVNQSERQLGAYISAALSLSKKSPRLLTNNEINFRNKVVHKGYIPTDDEAVRFGNEVMAIVNDNLEELRLLAPEGISATYEQMLPKGRQEGSPDEIIGATNILTALDGHKPIKENDWRRGGVTEQFKRIKREREPTRMAAMTAEEKKRRFPNEDSF